MKKAVFVFLCCVFFLSACAKLDYDNLSPGVDDSMLSNEVISDIREEGPLHGSSTFTVLFINKTGKELGYGFENRVEVYQNGGWYLVPKKENAASVHMLFVVLKPYETNEFTVDLSCSYAPLAPGRYRYLKNIGGLYTIAEFTVI